jgi:hydroxymethylbilane synthase
VRAGRLRLATRGSPLAQWQAGHVAAQLRQRNPQLQIELVLVETTGDVRRDVALHVIGGQGVFVREVQQAVLDGRADAAVHSAKDLPSKVAEGLVLAAVPGRGDPRDALVGRALDELPSGATVATGSVRRRAQLRVLRPDLLFVELRGNIGTRLERVPAGGAIVVAAAALDRLGWLDRAAEVFDVERVCPQVGQGALAVECRVDDSSTQALLGEVEHEPSRAAVDAERGFLSAFGGGCDLPVAAHATERGLLTFVAADDDRAPVSGLHPLDPADPAGSGRRAGELARAAAASSAGSPSA